MSAWAPAALLLGLATQVGPSRPVGTMYPNPVAVPLSSIALMGEAYQDQHVRTRGSLDLLELNRYHLLREAGTQVLILAIPELVSEMDRLVGREIEVRGVVRRLRKKEYVGPDRIDLDLLEHPDLPVLPAPGPGLPPFSLTVLAFLEKDDRARGRPGAGQVRGAAAMLLEDPPPPGQRRRGVVVGQFRGRNLFSDLPRESRRRPTDWVLKDGDTALWVTGRPPRGEGFALDPDYMPDTARWLEVSGTAEVVGGVLYLRASKVVLVKPPPQVSNEDKP